MAVVVLTSARGAPGVTTSALAIAMLWPRPVVLVEADVAGSSSILAGYLRGSVPPDRGLVSLAVAHRRGLLDEQFYDQTVPLIQDRVRLVPGLVSAQQAPSMDKLWSPLGVVLANLEHSGTDVIVDAGRLGMMHGPMPLVRSADALLLVTRTTLPAVSAARARVPVLRNDLLQLGKGDDTLAMLLVGEGQPYRAREIRSALETPVLASMAWDQAAADSLSQGAPYGRRFAAAPLFRSTRVVIGAVHELIDRHRARLAPASEGLIEEHTYG
jgi:MinD-like ATPase involved in chromosome partitioning or flagellar assembly